ncbi:MAG TPA: hypothetical protein PK425_11115 [Syntrophales bacterium]|nr:hypothetical protein [Syntrophales bacterium]HPX57075.1 hypothetical protein [Syntrophales bacterium]
MIRLFEMTKAHRWRCVVTAILVTLSSLAITGCTTRLTDFTIISTKNIDLSRGAEFIRGENRVTGEDTKHIIIFIPTGVPSPKEATDKAIENVPGAVALLDGVLEQEMFYFPYVYGYSTYRVKGTPLIDPKLKK